MRRILVDILLILSIFFFPWWLTLGLSLIALFYFDNFYEILFLGIGIDSLYNATIAIYHPVEFVATIIAIVLFVGVTILKNRLRLYSKL